LDFSFHCWNYTVIGPEPCHWFALPVDEELGEVPLDGVDEGARLGGLEKGKEGVGAGAVDLHLLHEIPGRSILLPGPGLHLLGGAWLLTSKLVAREGKDDEALGGGSLLQLHQLPVRAVRQTSLGCNVDHKDDFPPE